MSEWKTYRLGEICSRIKSGKGIPAQKVAPIGEYPVIGGNGVRGYTGITNFSGECAVVGRQGAYCGNVRFFSGSAYMTEHAVVIVGNELADTRYLAYLLSVMQLGNLSAQSAQPGLSVQTLSKLTVSIPDISTQRRIAGILGALDDKIELNRRINANLEEQAQALFKSWFVDFEPFRDGPFVDSELGKIPQGWKVLLFSDFCEHSTQKVEDKTVVEYSVTNFGMFPREQKYTKQLSQNISKDKLIRKRDLVFGMSREILNWGIMKNDQEGGVSAAYTVYHIKDEIDSVYLENYITFHKLYFKDLIKPAAREGQGIDKKMFENKILYYPPQNVLNNFFTIYNTLITNNQTEEIKTLAALRDTLLPKLMAGEITIKA